MPDTDDEDALHWAGEDLGGRVAPHPHAAASARVHQHEVESVTEADTVLDLDEDDELQLTSSSALVTIGVLAGLYFLYMLGWLTYALRSQWHTGYAVLDGMNSLGLWLSVAAAPLWFAMVFWLIERPALRYAVLVLGALLLIPIPLVWPK